MKAKKRARLPSLPKLRKQADKLWSTWILLLGTRPGFLAAVCGVCQEDKAISAHHVFHKSMHGRFRYSKTNGLPICRKCHFMERRDPAPVVFAAIRYHGCTEFMQFAADVMASRGQGAYVRKRADWHLTITALESAITEEVMRGSRSPA